VRCQYLRHTDALSGSSPVLQTTKQGTTLPRQHIEQIHVDSDFIYFDSDPSIIFPLGLIRNL
jgi:hypothetical protein